MREREVKPDGQYEAPIEYNEGTGEASVGLQNGSMSEIKWYSLDQIEEAKEYYSQYVVVETWFDMVDKIRSEDPYYQ